MGEVKNAGRCYAVGGARLVAEVHEVVDVVRRCPSPPHHRGMTRGNATLYMLIRIGLAVGDGDSNPAPY
jgi:hypothetical protein